VKADVAIVGGGPAGLAVAIHAARRGLSALVLERGGAVPDKACGEGLMPRGVRELEALGARGYLQSSDCAPLEGIRYIQEDATIAEARFPAGGGLGVRRVALVSALARRAKEVGVELREHCPVLSHRRTPGGIVLNTAAGEIDAQILIAADGLASPLRCSEGLDIPVRNARRFGLRQHFQLPPWSPFVEVHLSEAAEAYVTPVGARRVGVAFLWDDARVPRPVSMKRFQARFPALAERIDGAQLDSRPRGAGPFARSALARTADRFVLIGDAAGYVDAITGEGLSLAFCGAAALGRILPEAIARGATRDALAPYEREYAQLFRRYAWVTRAVLALARHPALRRRVLRGLAHHPKAFQSLLHWFAG
jgi:flavin-dependent dehydrogenase